jgi:NADPH-dependent 2,4-dienoyl-CoA reductase/sulfur reductase-like enzyme
VKLVVVGSGAAGNAAAFEARKADPSASITILSEDGLPLYSPCLLPQYLASSLPRERIFLKASHDYSRARIEFLHHKVTGIQLQKQQVLTATGIFRYDRLVLAMGSLSKKPAIEGFDKEAVLPLKRLEDVDKILSHLGPNVAVVGSGNIGIEVALALRTRGCRVVLFEAEPAVNPIFSPIPLSDLIQKALESEGVEVVTGARITRILGKGKAEGLLDRDAMRNFDLIINATGMVPNVEIAQRAGLAIGPKGGILVDRSMTTSHPLVYACGDCTEVLDDEYTTGTRLSALWPNATHQGFVTGSNAANIPRKHNGLLNLRILNIGDSFAVSLGWDEKDLAETGGFEPIDHRPHTDVFVRVYLFQRKLVAARFWGKAWKMGPLITCIQRHWNWGMLSSLFDNRKPLTRYPSMGQLQFLLPRHTSKL